MYDFSSCCPKASPLYTAPTSPCWSVAAERSTLMIALASSTRLFQAAIVPSSVANIKILGPDRFPLVISNASGIVAETLLKTVPVGVPAASPRAGEGMDTAGAMETPAPEYIEERPMPLSETHQGPVGLWASPQGFTRFGSMFGATPGRSATRGV